MRFDEAEYFRGASVPREVECDACLVLRSTGPEE